MQSTVGHGSSFIFHLPKEHQLNPVTAAILGDLTTRPQFQQLLRLTVRMVAEMTESKIVSLMLLDKDGRNLVVQSAYGLNESIVKSAHVAIGKGIAGRVLQSGRPLLVADVVKDGLIESGNRDQYETHSLVSVPLRIGDKAIGVINVNNKVSGAPFNEDDLALVTTLSDKVSAALEQAMQADSSARRVEKIVDALQALIVMKRNAIPTATPLARRLLVETARRLGLTRAEIRRLQYVASVHDVGMVAVDDEILHKTGPLTDDEHDEVTQHPEQGVNLVAPLLQAPEMSQIIMTHHERVDGSGYPRGLQGIDIPLGARILAVVDAFFAMSQERPWHESRPAEHAVAELRGERGPAVRRRGRGGLRGRPARGGHVRGVAGRAAARPRQCPPITNGRVDGSPKGPDRRRRTAARERAQPRPDQRALPGGDGAGRRRLHEQGVDVPARRDRHGRHDAEARRRRHHPSHPAQPRLRRHDHRRAVGARGSADARHRSCRRGRAISCASRSRFRGWWT